MIEEYLSKSWDAYKKNFWQVIGGLLLISLIMFGVIVASALPLVASFIGYSSIYSNIQTAFFQFVMDRGTLLSAILFVAGIIVALLISTVLEAGLVRMFADALKGKAEIRTMFSVARKKFWTILGANVLAGIIKLALLLVLVVPSVIAYSLEGISAVAYVAWLYGGLIVYMLAVLPFSLVNQFVAVGDSKAVESVKKSFHLVKGNYLQFLGLVVVLILISVAVSIVPFLGSMINFFMVVPLTGMAYTAFYLAKAKVVKKTAKGSGKKGK